MYYIFASAPLRAEADMPDRLPESLPLTRRGFLGAAVLTAAGGAHLFAQKTERKVDPIDLPLDRAGVWTLHFRYRDPRIVTVNVPGQGPKRVWYLWYQVYNKTSDPQTFIPEFLCVTKNPDAVFLDEPQPSLFNAVRELEDPTGVLNLKSTIAIAKQPIPPSSPDAIPRTVSGLAIWTDMTAKAPQVNRLSVYVLGLSNGLSTEQGPDGQTIISRKALQLKFVRRTDDNRPGMTDIRADTDRGPSEEWVYRVTSRTQGDPNADAKP